jgi:hypothetical protein
MALTAPTTRLLRALALAGASVVLALGLGACGSADKRDTTGTYAGEGGVSAPYLTVGSLVYQVQISRALNPYDEEDSLYLAGLTPAQAKLSPGEEWFAVFIQVTNESGHPQPSARRITIADTQQNVYVPVVPAGSNPFVYAPKTVEPNGRIPGLDSPAGSSPTQGALLLYKLKTYSLSNRPLELKIVDPTDPAHVAEAELDV